jgi:co-chaperonin GroES (HSP10)
MSKNYRPLFGRVLLEREILAKVGSIIIPEDQRKRQAICKGKIIALGETAGWTKTYEEKGEKFIRTINVGDTVSFGRHAGTWLDKSYGVAKDDDEAPYFLCQDEDLLAVIEGE